MKKNLYIGVGVILFIIVAFVLWFTLFRTSTPATLPPSTSQFGTSANRTNSNSTPGTNNNSSQTTSSNTSPAKIFKIADGPVAGATFVETHNPTTTVVRYTMQDNGHVLDLPVDVPGAVPRPVSNTTIPGIATTLWTEQGSGMLLQYIEKQVVKTIAINLSVATTSALGAPPGPVKIQFLPNNISSAAVSPDGKNIAYFLPTKTGLDGYIADSRGANGRKLFSSQLTQVSLSWPAQDTLLVQTRAAAGVPGMIFSVNTKTGASAALVSALGISAIADTAFSKIIYQTSDSGATKKSTYAHSMVTGKDLPMPLDLFPEKCSWSRTMRSRMYCAIPFQYVAPNYLDLWHQGLAGVPDVIYAIDTTNSNTELVTIPGNKDGGVQSDIVTIGVSPDEHYLLFIKRGDRSLWGVRLVK